MVIHRADLVDYPVDFIGEYSPDGGMTFRTLFSVAGNRMDAATFTVERSFEPVVADNFRLRIDRSSYREQPYYAQLSEIEVFGEYVRRAATEDSARRGRWCAARMEVGTRCAGRSSSERRRTAD